MKKKKISITARANQFRCSSSSIEKIWCKHFDLQFFKKRKTKNIHFSFLFSKTYWEIALHLCIYAFLEIFILYQNFCSALFIYVCKLSFDLKHIRNIIFFFRKLTMFTLLIKICKQFLLFLINQRVAFSNRAHAISSSNFCRFEYSQ